jgi:beta-1,3-galactosyltransferase 1
MASTKSIVFSVRTFVAVLCFLFIYVGVNFFTSTSHLHKISCMSAHIQTRIGGLLNNTVLASSINMTSVYVTRTMVNSSNVMLTKSTVNQNVNNYSNSSAIYRQSKPDNLPVKNRTRQDECKMCFRHDFKYVIDNPKIVMIFTEHKLLTARDAIRQTWISAADSNSKTSNIRYAFLLGYTSDEKASADVLQESSQYGDIIKEDFLDSYKNLTYKTMMAYKWVSSKCSRAKYVMKTDDDMFVNIPAIIQLLNQTGDQLQNAMTGACNQKAGPIRDARSKWFASITSYPRNSYPGFCSGTGYVTSGHLAKKVYEISHTVPFFHLEDVYVSLCIKKLGFKLIGVPGFCLGGPRNTCKHKSDGVKTIHHVPPPVLVSMWKRKC